MSDYVFGLPAINLYYGLEHLACGTNACATKLPFHAG